MNYNHAIKIGDKKIAMDKPCFIIAEAGVNHNGDLVLAKKLIDMAHEAGADAIKFQTFKAEHLVTRDAEKAEYQEKNDKTTATQYQMLKKLEFSKAGFKILQSYAKKKGLIFLSSAFDDESLDLLTQLNVPAYKVPSGEINNIPYLKTIARNKKPVILSTGMSTMTEVGEALTLLRQYGCKDIILLHCTTSYPAPLESVNLRVMDALHTTYGLPVGYSDHTEGIIVALAAVARGACVIEKHITLDRALPGPDHAASLEPRELKQMICAIRDVEKALGVAEKKLELCEVSN